ncbi:MAG: YkgJ family cysteine cluster protein [Acidobacteriota bacterium]
MDDERWLTGNITVLIGEIPVNMELTVPAFQVKPTRMLPIFQKMTNAIVGLSENEIRATGAEISCKMGCGACCRQPVPISEAEVYQIAELVNAMPEPRQAVVRERFQAAADHFRSLGWFDRIAELADSPKPADPDQVPNELIAEALKYFQQGIACPFLEDESCSIHESRPLACREYLVTSPPENCSNPSAATIDKVPIVLHPSRAMRLVGQTGLLNRWGVLPLIRALELAESVPETFAEKTGERWAAEFFEHLTHSQIPENSVGASEMEQPSDLRKIEKPTTIG